MKAKITVYALAILFLTNCQNSKTETELISTNDDSIEVETQIESTINDSTEINDYQIESSNDEIAEKLIDFLREKNQKDISNGVLSADDRKFSFYEIDLNDDTKNEYLIFLQGSYFCGRGGCSFYLLNNDFSVNTYFTVTYPPIFRSSGSTDGWHDLILYGDSNPDGGVKNYVHLKYDKSKGKYPSNPSLIAKIEMAPSGHDFVMWHDEFSKAKPYTF